VDSGGTSATSFTPNGVAYANTTSTGALQSTAAGTAGQLLESNGASAPSYLNATIVNPTAAFAYLGGDIKSEPISGGILISNGTQNMSNQFMYIAAIYVSTSFSCTGAEWFQNTAGSYIVGSSGYNGFELFTESGGMLTMVDSTTRDTTIWQKTATTFGHKASGNVDSLKLQYNEKKTTKSKAAKSPSCTPDMEKAYIRRIEELEEYVEELFNNWLEEFDKRETLEYKLSGMKKRMATLKKQLPVKKTKSS
jgi:hypothetical protein